MAQRAADWAVRRRGRGGSRAALLLVLLAVSVGAYVYKLKHPPSLATIVGTAFVVDGDTIDIWARRIRLEAIDAPELEQTCTDAQGRPWACGTVAAEELRRFIKGHALTCEPTRLDQYQRVLATCLRPDGANVNAWMVREGWALAFRTTRRYRAEEDDAKAARRGLWAGTFTPPWEWRDARRPDGDLH